MLAVPDGFMPFARTEIEQSIPARFSKIVARFPGRLAVVAPDESIDYAELDARASAVAYDLLDALGPAPQAVAVLAGQECALLVAILGVLKARKFYVPLDDAHPDATNRERIVHSGAAAIVASAAMSTHASALGVSLPVIVAGRASTQDPRVAVAADDIAYVYYTSGSTGKPKGVFDSHRNVLHNVMRYTNGLYLNAQDRLTLLQSASFSGAVSSLFGALLNGAASCPFDLRQLAGLPSWILDTGITVYHSVPSVFRTLGDTGVHYPRVRVVRLEGDQATRRDLLLFGRAFASHAALVNGLGTTETGLVRRFVFRRGDALPEPVVPIGYPVPDMEVLLLDDLGEPAVNGAAGEIAVRSRYLALGYWRDPERTRARFVDAGDEFRVYRSGDVGRLRDDGCLVYLGRTDFQAKLRGVAVDLAQIEAVVQSLDCVRHAVVTVSPGPDDEPRLVAYIVTTGPAVTLGDLRRPLQARLSGVEVPQLFVFVDRLPLDANGKVDRRALATPLPRRPALDAAFVEPRNDAERALARIWSEVLGVGPIGVDDRFLDLGGDSLDAARIVARIHDSGGSLTLADVFEAATIAALAQRLVGPRSMPT